MYFNRLTEIAETGFDGFVFEARREPFPVRPNP
jgi:hypothetical protein